MVGRVAAGVGAAMCPGRVEGKCVGWAERMGVCWVVVKGAPIVPAENK